VLILGLGLWIRVLDDAAHLGGFAAGLLLAPCFAWRRRRPPDA